tara:strand:- start:150665 stop:151750 length:1086 start_codon:yes stop_codon:yes gene_type:complete
VILSDLYPYLILIGATILAVTAWLLHQANAQNARSRELVKINESLNFDLPDFLRQCWPVLNAGGFVGLTWKLDWFGTRLEGTHGTVSDRALDKRFDTDEISLEIQLFSAKSGWERRYFSQSLAEKFFLLLRMDVWIKLGSVRSTFAQAAKMTVFLQHDIKNMLQLTSLAAEQLLEPVPGQDARLLSMLRVSVPALRDRVELMLTRLKQQNTGGVANTVDIAAYLAQSAAAHELPVQISGTAQVTLTATALQSITDNLLGNYADMARKQPDTGVSLDIVITSNPDTVLIDMSDLHGKPCLWPERLFEPFWSEHGTGRGVGLYQARQTALSLGGKLAIHAPADQPLHFLLELPVQIISSQSRV